MIVETLHILFYPHNITGTFDLNFTFYLLTFLKFILLKGVFCKRYIVFYL